MKLNAELALSVIAELLNLLISMTILEKHFGKHFSNISDLNAECVTALINTMNYTDYKSKYIFNHMSYNLVKFMAEIIYTVSL